MAGYDVIYNQNYAEIFSKLHIADVNGEGRTHYYPCGTSVLPLDNIIAHLYMFLRPAIFKVMRGWYKLSLSLVLLLLLLFIVVVAEIRW